MFSSPDDSDQIKGVEVGGRISLCFQPINYHCIYHHRPETGMFNSIKLHLLLIFLVILDKMYSKEMGEGIQEMCILEIPDKGHLSKKEKKLHLHISSHRS